MIYVKKKPVKWKRLYPRQKQELESKDYIREDGSQESPEVGKSERKTTIVIFLRTFGLY
jgi:hypothetical protein